MNVAPRSQRGDVSGNARCSPCNAAEHTRIVTLP